MCFSLFLVSLSLTNDVHVKTIAVGSEEYAFHYAADSVVHHLYSLDFPEVDHLERVGSVSAKLTVRPDASGPSSAKSKLKERREAEQARKEGQRTVLLEDAPSTPKPAVKSSSLKLRAKALAPLHSPLVSSRAVTPLGSEHPPSLPGTPGLAPKRPEAPLRAESASKCDFADLAHLRRQLRQLLAQGPLQRREIVQALPHTEPQIMPALNQMTNAPEELQTLPAGNRKFSGPVNRRNASLPTSSPASAAKGVVSNHTPSTVHVLKDEEYCRVLVKDWKEYSPVARAQVSTLMRAALDRLGVAQGAAERLQLIEVKKGPHQSAHQNLLHGPDDGEELSEVDLGISKMNQEESPNKLSLSEQLAQEKALRSKKIQTTQDRLARAAKGKATSASARRTNSPARASLPISCKDNKAADREQGPRTPADGEVEQASHMTQSLSPQEAQTIAQERPSNKRKESAVHPQSAEEHVPASRRRIDYTDSSEGDSSGAEERTRPSRRERLARKSLLADETSGASLSASAHARPASRDRQGVGRGATSVAEPWLDVQSARDWRELAKRFQRVYNEYRLGMDTLHSEEALLIAELTQARDEETAKANRDSQGESGKAKTQEEKQSGASNKRPIPEDAAAAAPDEPEEGEASPTVGAQSAVFGDDISNHGPAGMTELDHNTTVAWRQGTMQAHAQRSTSSNGSGDTRSANTTKSSLSSAGTSSSSPPRGPMALDEMQRLVADLLETDGQLRRMRIALQSSKGRLTKAS